MVPIQLTAVRHAAYRITQQTVCDELLEPVAGVGGLCRAPDPPQAAAAQVAGVEASSGAVAGGGTVKQEAVTSSEVIARTVRSGFGSVWNEAEEALLVEIIGGRALQQHQENRQQQQPSDQPSEWKPPSSSQFGLGVTFWAGVAKDFNAKASTVAAAEPEAVVDDVSPTDGSGGGGKRVSQLVEPPPVRTGRSCAERWRRIIKDRSEAQKTAALVVIDRSDFLAAMAHHGLDWLATNVQQAVPRPPRDLPDLSTKRKSSGKRGPAKGTKYKKSSLSAGAAASPAVADGGARASLGAGASGVGAGDLDDPSAWAYQEWGDGHREPGDETGSGGGGGIGGGESIGEESENVLNELIGLYESQRGEPPTDDAIRSWMMTLQEATATSALAEGVGEDEDTGGTTTAASAAASAAEGGGDDPDAELYSPAVTPNVKRHSGGAEGIE